MPAGSRCRVHVGVINIVPSADCCWYLVKNDWLSLLVTNSAGCVAGVVPPSAAMISETKPIKTLTPHTGRYQQHESVYEGEKNIYVHLNTRIEVSLVTRETNCGRSKGVTLRDGAG